MPESLPLFAADVLTPSGEPGVQAWRTLALTCQKCALSSYRTNVVFGEGNPNEPDICFVGEGPGRQEDESGRPFIGNAGQLLNRMIAAMGLRREDQYICNVVNCRPPENRTPEKKEIQACQPYLIGQLEAVRPKTIVALGGTATAVLLETKKGIVELRGRWATWRGIPVMPTYHPAHLLRQSTPEAKRAAWTDLRSVMEKLGRPILTPTSEPR